MKPRLHFRGIKGIKAGSIILVSWENMDNEAAVAKAESVIGHLQSQGAVPSGVTVCTVPHQFSMSVMTVAQLTDAITELTEALEILVKATVPVQRGI